MVEPTRMHHISAQGQIAWGVYPYDGGVYTGTWSVTLCRPEGYGTLTYKQADSRHSYSGGWQAGKPHGYGTLIYKQADARQSYSGGWQTGKRHGHGTLTYKSQARYDGCWVNDEQQGDAVMTYALTTTGLVQFVGKYHMGEKKKGVLSCMTYSGVVVASYSGRFRNGVFHDIAARVQIGNRPVEQREYINGRWYNMPPGVNDELEVLSVRYK